MTVESHLQPIGVLLPLLSNVRETAPDRWLASCPTAAHERGDRNPSLSIRELPDGVVLLRCYSMQCDARDITNALGLELRDLFPNRVTDRRRLDDVDRLPYRDALLILRREAHVVWVAAEHTRDRVPLSDSDIDRVRLALARLGAVIDATGVR